MHANLKANILTNCCREAAIWCPLNITVCSTTGELLAAETSCMTGDGGAQEQHQATDRYGGDNT